MKRLLILVATLFVGTFFFFGGVTPKVACAASRCENTAPYNWTGVCYKNSDCSANCNRCDSTLGCSADYGAGWTCCDATYPTPTPTYTPTPPPPTPTPGCPVLGGSCLASCSGSGNCASGVCSNLNGWTCGAGAVCCHPLPTPTIAPTNTPAPTPANACETYGGACAVTTLCNTNCMICMGSLGCPVGTKCCDPIPTPTYTPTPYPQCLGSYQNTLNHPTCDSIAGNRVCTAHTTTTTQNCSYPTNIGFTGPYNATTCTHFQSLNAYGCSNDYYDPNGDPCTDPNSPYSNLGPSQCRSFLKTQANHYCIETTSGSTGGQSTTGCYLAGTPIPTQPAGGGGGGGGGGGTPTYTLSGTIYLDYAHTASCDPDINNNCTKPTFLGGNVTVNYNGSTTTSSNGSYSVNVPAGDYGVYIEPTSVPSGYDVSDTSVPIADLTAGSKKVHLGVTPKYSISGIVYTDVDKGGTYGGSDAPFTQTVTGVKLCSDSACTTNSTLEIAYTDQSTGAFSFDQTDPNMISGTYYLKLILPTGYEATTATIYSVQIGQQGASGITCAIGGNPNASCKTEVNTGLSGSIQNLDFGISNARAWFQGVCTDMRMDNGFSDPLPNTGACGGVTNAYALITDSTCTEPGVAYTGDGSASFGSFGGQVSTTGKIVGGGAYPETYSPVSPTVIRTSYNYLRTSMTQLGITSIDLSGTDSLSGQPYCGIGGITDCTLESNLPNGIYQVNGNLTLNAYTFPVNKSYVFLVNGDLTIKGNILVPTGSFAMFSSSGNIYVDKNVGEATITSRDANIQGIYSADNSFVLQTFASGGVSCNADGTPIDKRLNITGVVIVNAAGVGGSIQNQRDLCYSDTVCPTWTLSMGIGNVSGGRTGAGIGSSYWLYAPAFVKHQNTVWQESSPATSNAVCQ